MKKPTGHKVRNRIFSKRELRQTAIALSAVLAFVAVGVVVFLRFYSSYIDEILYKERLSQMREVTTQLFSGLEDVIKSEWRDVNEQIRSLQEENPGTLEELVAHMEKESYLADMDSYRCNIVAIDEDGMYYTQRGQQGLLSEREYLFSEPERISFVSNSLIYTEARMVFLKRLEKPMVVTDGSKEIRLLYYGISQDMEELNPYFECSAYSGTSSVYVVDDKGLKLFNSSSNDLLKGYNIFHVLDSMEYLHGSSFTSTREQLEEEHIAYSNAMVDGTEIYYALYNMDNAAWTLIFLVPSAYVATNTVALVNITIRLVMIFAVALIAISTVYIFVLTRMQQKQALDTERRNNEALESLNVKLEAASKAKSNFLANMSHDIRTPMNAIVGITNLMAYEKNDPEKLEIYIDKVKMSSQHLLSLINDVLDMSKIESGEITLNVEQISLAEQVRQVESIIRSQATEHGQEFEIRVHEIFHEYLIGDCVRLRQIFINLLSNAVKYTPNGGKITLDLAELPCGTPDHAKFGITVSDNGYGMSPEFVEHIFEPFTRAVNSTTNKIQGTGLGMAITKNIVDLMNGTIQVQSEPGKGTTFEVSIELPIDNSVDTDLGIRSVLLITGNETLIRNVRASLQEANITLHTAATVAEADQLLQDTEVDVILLSGYLQDRLLKDEVRELRNSSKQTVQIFYCDYAQREDVQSILTENGMDGLVSRPFFLSNLLHAVEGTHDNAAAAISEKDSILKGMRFLCAEDNELNAEILEAILSMSGAECDIYPDGRELVKAFDSVKDGDYAAILMDVQMPNMNGLEAARAIRHGSNPLGKTIPIIAMTANAFSSDVQDCLDAGMDAHVAKPLDMAMLERTLREIFRGGVRSV